MTFRTRILIACVIVALLPLSMFALGARRAVRSLLTEQFRARVAASAADIQQEFDREANSLDNRLDALIQRIDADPVLRAALLRNERGTLLDYAPSVMRAAGLDYLQLVDSAGTLLSSGHFRNDYDRSIAALPALVPATGLALVSARRPQGGFLALARAQSFRIGDRAFVLAGGTEIDSRFVRGLARDADTAVVVSLSYPGGRLASADSVRSGAADQRVVPFIDDVNGEIANDSARWSITHSLTPLQRVLRSMDTWLLAAGAAAVLLAIVIAQVLAARVNRPLEELAEKTTQINLDRLDVEFTTDREDEVGALSRMMAAMIGRLRSGAQQLRAAERRATVGDLARQVNHDLRNGLLPIRNVIRHLSEVARESPQELGSVFVEREGTLQGGIGYLESLATNYARLSPPADRQSCDLNAIIRTVLRDAPVNERARVQLELSPDAPRVSADPISLRRIIENLGVNAIESLENGTGVVRVNTSVSGPTSQRRVTIVIADTGVGIAPDQLDHIFDDFYSTKERGSGLGLSIVRRLVADLGGRIQVESERGRGTRFVIELPGV
ncbi:MAG: ATP-binding protein [Gemmatimonadota bacterium]